MAQAFNNLSHPLSFTLNQRAVGSTHRIQPGARLATTTPRIFTFGARCLRSLKCPAGCSFTTFLLRSTAFSITWADTAEKLRKPPLRHLIGRRGAYRVASVSLALKISQSRKTTTPEPALRELRVTIKLSAWQPPRRGRFLFGRLWGTMNIRSS